MSMTFKTLCHFTQQLVRSAHITVLCATLAFSPLANSVEIVLGSAMNVRSYSDDELAVAGTLGVGSIVEVPDRFKVKRKDGRIDADATFKNWLKKAGARNQDSAKNPYYYPVRIRVAKGAGSQKLVGKTLFMALGVLKRSRGGLTVKKTSLVYQPPRGAFPRRAATTHPEPAPARHAEAAPAPVPPVSDDTSAAIKDSATQADANDNPVPTPETNPNAQESNDPAEAQSGAGTDCPSCDAAKSAAETLTDAVNEPLRVTVYRTESRGLQGLTQQFPRTKLCEAFIKPDGTYGSLGLKVLNAMSSSDAFTKDWSRSAKALNACPNFNKFSDEERRHFWVYAFAAMEAQESKCNQGAAAASDVNDHGVASGGGQIEERKDLRIGRDKVYGGHFCAGPNPSNPDLNIRCSVRMLQDMAENGEGPYSTTQNRFGQYWASYKWPKMEAKALISQYAACGAVPYYKWNQPPLPAKYWLHHKRSHKSRHAHHRGSQK